jgi:mannose-6-phosphate isomerase-like protein (cupin superfamily)
VRVIKKNERPFVAAGHEDPRNPGVLKKVLFQKADLQPGAVQMVNWAKLPIGRSFAAHYHEDMQELFIMVQGVARLVVDGQTAVLRAGDAVLIDAREVHQMGNDGEEDVEYIAVGITRGEGGRTIVVEEGAESPRRRGVL